MLRHATYPYEQMPQAPTHRYSGTSSAFSASANPNEDWTKISDLAERRRIQNRIAQRNYRKKLKKRLEDLERRAASNSASPEQRPAELERAKPESRRSSADSKKTSSQARRSSQQSAAVAQQQPSPYFGAAPADDRSMFSQQFTRQLSTSPPPFSYSHYPAETTAYAPYSQSGLYQALTTATQEQGLLATYLPPLAQAATFPPALPSMIYPSAAPAATKQDFYSEGEMSPFSMSYASMAGIDIPQAQAYQDTANSQITTPPLSDSFEQSIAGSPPDFTNFPTTPSSMPGTPPLRMM